MIVGHRRLGQDRHTGARRDEIGDETDTFDLDRHAELDVLGARRGLDLVAQRVARGRKDQRSRSRGPPARSAPFASGRDDAGTSATRSSSRRCSTTSRGSLTGSVTTALASSRSATSHREPLRRAFGEPQRQAGRDAPHLGHDHRARAERLTVPTTPSVACPVSRPCSIERSLCSASSSLRIARARSMTRTPNSVGTVPRRPRTSSCTPSSASSWRTCSGNVRLDRVQAVGGGREAALLGHREQRLELANVHVRPRSGRSQERSGPLCAPIANTDRSYRYKAFDRWSCDRVHYETYDDGARGADLPPTGSRAQSRRPRELPWSRDERGASMTAEVDLQSRSSPVR